MRSSNKTRVAALGMAGALALGTVAAIGVAAPASAVATQYNCVTSSGTLPFGVTTDNPLAGPYVAGETVAAQPVSINVGILAAILDALRPSFPAGLTTLSGTIADAPLAVGTQQVTMTGLVAPPTTIPAPGNAMTLPIAGTTTPFTAPAPGSYPVLLPTNFSFQPSFLASPVPCSSSTGQPVLLGNMTVAKDSSTTKATLKNAPIDTSDHAKIAVKVRTGQGAPAAGKVVAKEGSKTLAKGTLNDYGKKKLTLPLLSKGSHKIVVKYKGNSSTESSKKTVKFTVTK